MLQTPKRLAADNSCGSAAPEQMACPDAPENRDVGNYPRLAWILKITSAARSAADAPLPSSQSVRRRHRARDLPSTRASLNRSS